MLSSWENNYPEKCLIDPTSKPTGKNLYAGRMSKQPLQFTSAFVTLAPLAKLRRTNETD
jgi:hypothetical protein